MSMQIENTLKKDPNLFLINIYKKVRKLGV